MRGKGQRRGRFALIGAVTMLGFAAVLTAAAQPTGANGADSLIAFESDRGGHVDIWVMRPDGSNTVNLTGGPRPSRRSSRSSWTRSGASVKRGTEPSGSEELVPGADGFRVDHGLVGNARPAPPELPTQLITNHQAFLNTGEVIFCCFAGLSSLPDIKPSSSLWPVESRCSPNDQVRRTN